MNSRIVYLLIPIIIFVASFLVYLPSLKNSFVWDDQILIERSYKKFKNVDFSQLFFPEQNKSQKGVYYRPVVRTTLTSDYLLWEKNSFGYHLTNNLLFSFTAIAFYFLALIIYRQFRKEEDLLIPVSAATLVFILHPIHVESVSWIVGRTDLLCGLFFILAFIAHIKSKSLFILAAPVFFILSLMSKEVAVAFPFVVVFYDILARRYNLRSLSLLIIYLLILALYIFMRTRSFTNTAPLDLAPGTAVPEDASGFLIYIEPFKTFICSLGIYIEKLLLPINLNAYIPKVPTGAVNLVPSIILTAIVAAAFVFGIIKKYYILSLSIFITFVTLGPSLLLSVMPIAATPVAERYLFVPSVGYSLVVGLLFLELNKRFGIVLAIIPLVLLSALYLYINVDRQAVWKDRLSFWAETSKNSVYAFPHSNYALALEENGEYEETLNAYAVALSPDFIDTDHGRAMTANNLALYYIKNEQYRKAENTLNKALKLSPEYKRTFYNLGLINYIKGEVTGSQNAYNTALKYVNKASGYYQRNPKFILLRAKILIKVGKTDLALKQIDKAVNSGLEGELLNEARAIKKVYEKTGNNNPGNNTDQQPEIP